MAHACKLIAGKLAAAWLVLGLLVAPLCAIRCAAHNCASSHFFENGAHACHHQAASRLATGLVAQSCSDSCNPPELVLDLPRVQVQPADSPAPHDALSSQSVALLLATGTNGTFAASPPGWPAASLSSISIDPHLSAQLRI